MQDIIKAWQDAKAESNNPNFTSCNDYIARTLANHKDIENVFLPVQIEGKLIQFTNIGFSQNSSGKEFILVKIGNEYHFAAICHEPDIDGAYWTFCIVKLFDTRSADEYTMFPMYAQSLCTMLRKL